MSSQIRKKSQNAAAEQQTEAAMVIAETPARPWSRLSTDLFEYRGGHYPLCIDQYSWRSLSAHLFHLSDSVLIRLDFCVKTW